MNIGTGYLSPVYESLRPARMHRHSLPSAAFIDKRQRIISQYFSFVGPAELQPLRPRHRADHRPLPR
jgi:hypothetical protein